jgi:hypothetical protein
MAKTRKAFKDRMFDFANNILAGAAWAVAAMMASILYTHFGPGWARPIVNGLITFSVVCGAFFVWRALLSLPAARPKLDVDNVDERLLEWFHKFNLEVKTFNDEHSYFLYRVTTDANRSVAISRSNKIYADQLTMKAILTPTEDEKQALDSLDDAEKVQLLYSWQIEMNRTLIGYRTNNWLTEGVSLSKFLPISENLNEEKVLAAIWQMEAAISTIYAIGNLAVATHRLKGLPAVLDANIEKRIP